MQTVKTTSHLSLFYVNGTIYAHRNYMPAKISQFCVLRFGKYRFWVAGEVAGGDEMVKEKERYRFLSNIDFEWPVELPVGEWAVAFNHLLREVFRSICSLHISTWKLSQKRGCCTKWAPPQWVRTRKKICWHDAFKALLAQYYTYHHILQSSMSLFNLHR